MTLSWDQLRLETARLIVLSAPAAIAAEQIKGADVYHNPDLGASWVSFRKVASEEAAQEAMRILERWSPGGVAADVAIAPSSEDEPWVCVKKALKTESILGPFADITGWKSGPINSLWGGPRPLANTLAGAALGAGAGYGAGWLAEQFLPEDHFEPKKLRRSLALAGAGFGAIPGLYHAYDNHTQGISPFLAQWPAKVASWTGADITATIPRDRLNRIIWDDPYLDAQTRNATGSLIDAAAAVGGSPIVSIGDVGRIAVGMGSGYAAGRIVGKVLSAITGLSAPAAKELQRAGTIAGLVKAVVPMAFGRN